MQITKKKKTVALILYVLGLLIFFGVILFPEDTVRTVAQTNIKRLDPNLGVEIGKAGPALPFSIKLSDLHFVYNKEAMASSDYVKLTPAPGVFFGAGPVGSFAMALFDGEISGSYRPAESGGYRTEARVSGIRLEALPSPGQFLNHRLSGDFNGEIAALIGGDRLEATGELSLSGFTLEFKTPVFDISEVRLDLIEADIRVDDKRVRISRGVFHGEDFNGQVTGDILYMVPYEMSRLRLKGFVRPQASFISRLSRNLPVEMLIRQHQGSQGVPLRIEGTIKDPKLSFR